MVIREQLSILASTYNVYVRQGGAASARQYFAPPADLEVPLFDADHFRYDRLLRHYVALFGRENVLVLAFEELRRAPHDFAARLLHFVGLDGASVRLPFDDVVKASISPFEVALTRRRNLFGPPRSTVNPTTFPGAPLQRGISALRTLDRFVPSSVQSRLDAGIRSEIDRVARGRYRESNRCTAELTGLDLAALGYDV